MSTAITPSLVQQPAESRPATVESAAQSGGAVITGLKVVERSAPDTPGGVARGVLIEGKFYPVELPPDVREGERVNVKITVDSAGAPKISYVARTQQPDASPNAGIPSKLLESLLKTFDLNQQTVETLKQVLSPLIARGSAPSNLIEVAPFLRQLLRDSRVPELPNLRDPRVVSSFIGAATDSAIGRLLAKAVDARMSTLQSTVGGRAAELMRLIVKELEVSGAKSTVFAAGGGSKPAPTVSRPVTDNEKATQLLRAIAPHFEAIIDKAATRTGEMVSSRDPSMRAFSELLGAQLDAVRTFEARFRTLLGDDAAPDPITRLLVALKDLEAAVKNDTSPLGEKIRAFVNTFSTEIERALAHFEDSLVLRQVLERGLQTLYETFNLTPLIERFLNLDGSDTVADMPLTLKGSLRLIETQLVALLSDPDFDQKVTDLFQTKGGAFLGKLQQLYQEVEQTLKQHPEELASPRFAKVLERFEEAKRVLTQVFESELQGEAPTPAQLKTALQALHTAITQVPTQSYENEFSLPFNGKNPSETVQRIVRNIERLLLDLLPRDTVSGEQTIDTIEELQKLIAAGKFSIPREVLIPDQNGSREPKRFEFQNLKTLLKQLAIELPASGDTLENELLDTTFNFIDQIDAFERGTNQRAPVLKDAAQRALHLFRSHLGRLDVGNVESEQLNLIDTDTLNRVSQLVHSQDTLLRMIPVIKSLGEPVLMLFPFIIGGFLTRGQISFSTSHHDGRDTQSSSQGTGAAELFSRIKIVLPLPSLGDVLVDAAYRPGEMLLNFGLENSDAATFFESRCVDLRRILQALGYTKIQISVVEISHSQRETALSGSPLEALWGVSNAVG